MQGGSDYQLRMMAQCLVSLQIPPTIGVISLLDKVTWLLSSFSERKQPEMAMETCYLRWASK